MILLRTPFAFAICVTRSMAICSLVICVISNTFVPQMAYLSRNSYVRSKNRHGNATNLWGVGGISRA